MELRPLGFGEIFDRAITLYIRNFVPFALIVGVMIVPLAVLQYFVDASSIPQFDAMMKILTHPGKAPAFQATVQVQQHQNRHEHGHHAARAEQHDR